MTSPKSHSGPVHVVGAGLAGSEAACQVANAGIPVLAGFKPENLPLNADVYVVGNAISRGNQELETLLEKSRGEDGHIVFNGTVATPYLRNAIWDKLKTINGLKKDDAAPAEVKANIKVSDDSVYHKHTVVAGETLGKIAKHYFDDASKYVAIFEANKDILKNPDLIVVGQVLSIPNP